MNISALWNRNLPICRRLTSLIISQRCCTQAFTSRKMWEAPCLLFSSHFGRCKKSSVKLYQLPHWTTFFQIMNNAREHSSRATFDCATGVGVVVNEMLIEDWIPTGALIGGPSVAPQKHARFKRLERLTLMSCDFLQKECVTCVNNCFRLQRCTACHLRAAGFDIDFWPWITK